MNMTETILVSDDAYELLAKSKLPNESLATYTQNLKEAYKKRRKRE
jgi:predicted CopG family antitoxin